MNKFFHRFSGHGFWIAPVVTVSVCLIAFLATQPRKEEPKEENQTICLNNGYVYEYIPNKDYVVLHRENYQPVQCVPIEKKSEQ